MGPLRLIRVKKDWYTEGSNGRPRSKHDSKRMGGEDKTTTPRLVMFVEQTPGGELAKRIRELFTRIEPTVGSYVKVLERSGSSLQSQFPLTTLW